MKQFGRQLCGGKGSGTLYQAKGALGAARRRRDSGMTLIELLIGAAVASVMVGIGVPLVSNATKSYHLMAAVPGVTGAIQSTRYQAIMTGCPFAIAFSQNTTSYQVSQEVLSGSPPACASTFTNVGNTIPWSTSADVTMSASVTLQFSPNGTMIVTTSPNTVPATFSLTNGLSTENITISGVGNVTVSP